MPSLEEKKAALEVLIRQSIQLDESKKPELVYKIPQMTEQDIDTLGQFLAMEVDQAGQFYAENLPKLEKFLTEIEDYEQKNLTSTTNQADS
ncbi:MAG: hypothetical protein COU63_01290 [Candidatus Pacebacteria bacterium CG10_big_fil_rev_8_21_14_0_10_36_11]|nr:hypothetical protein [Candidatus Pacearchaeota archaeon]OIP73778.1 MAG: hypothetical protein AUK08_04430 [Candidatus Pacebacteria bacterium CG2_30_36_39]PIR64636.1 MAG: hypothetical protein COU63_01290 [Candidatus Pacebacteria bacterium CG10_big_fil_rev_8_21_14_0_10_36_11]PJC43011.1 MAG: hypothetical protein CO040_01360 [Candidatus Pacebacteria bacterium CG_4_9_14_0_2_um_filter_36_8]